MPGCSTTILSIKNEHSDDCIVCCAMDHNPLLGYECNKECGALEKPVPRPSSKQTYSCNRLREHQLHNPRAMSGHYIRTESARRTMKRFCMQAADRMPSTVLSRRKFYSDTNSLYELVHLLIVGIVLIPGFRVSSSCIAGLLKEVRLTD